MKSFGYDKEEWQAMRTVRSGDMELSERSFHLVFGGTLLWGLLLNVVMVLTLSDKIARFLYTAQNPTVLMIVFLVGYIVCCFAGSVLTRNENPMVGFAGFNLIALPVGLLLSVFMTAYLDDPVLVRNAITLTLVITALMMIFATIAPSFFQGIGRILLISLSCVILVELVSFLIFRQSFGLYDYLVAAIMCLYIGFDWGRVTTCARTPRNAICIAASLYLDIVNLFIRIVEILSRNRNNS